MKSASSFIYLLLAGVCLALALSATALAAGDDWKPVDPAELATKEPVVEKDADAEVLQWEVRVDDDAEDLVFSNYIRIKVFTERGRESQSKVDIPFYGQFKIKDIAARTIKPDSTIVELKKDDVFERTVIKVSGLKVKVKSFALPSVEPGSIIEYRWREVRPGRLANYVRLPFQREIPVRSVTYYVKPLSSPYFPYNMRYFPFHMPNPNFAKAKNGFYSATLTNVPAYHEEARMPPEDQVRSWILIYYSKDRNLNDPAKFWKEWGKEVYDIHKSDIKVNDEVRAAATSAIGDATTEDQKLERLYDFVRTKIKNVWDDNSGLSPDERAKLKVNKSPADTLKRGMGTGEDVTMLFGALAAAAGFDARVVELSDRSDIFLNQNFADPYFMRLHAIAIRSGDGWRYFDPSSTYTPFGMLPWKEEGQKGLLLDSKEPVWVDTPMSQPEKSVEKRSAELTLGDDGEIEGDVRIEYYGHAATDMKENNDEDSPTEREQSLRDLVKSHWSTAEISDIRIENVTDPVKPFVYSFHVRVPGYAQRTGKRLFLRPAFFQYGEGALFNTSDRKNHIYFHYPWSEEDKVTIHLPEGFALDNADKPAPLDIGEITAHKVSIFITKDNRTLIYKRSFFFGGKEKILFPTTAYPPLKEYFDIVNKADAHTITLKQGTATASTSGQN